MKLVCELEGWKLYVSVFAERKKRKSFEVELFHIGDEDPADYLRRSFRERAGSDLEEIKEVSLKLFFGAGGEQGVEADEEFLAGLRGLVEKYPFYVPMAELVLKAVSKIFSPVKVRIFTETSFFRQLPRKEKIYPIALDHAGGNMVLPEKNGFHGILHEYSGKVIGAEEKVISIVLGDLSTVAAIKDGMPAMISLGNSPTEGIMGRTNCGDIDPGLIFHMIRETGADIYEIDRTLKEKSGFYGVTGFDRSIVELQRYLGSDDKVDLAFKVFRSHLMKYIGYGIAALGGVDTIVFSGRELKELIPFVYGLTKDLSFLGIHLYELPWDTEEICFVSDPTSGIKIVLNFLDTSAIVNRWSAEQQVFV